MAAWKFRRWILAFCVGIVTVLSVQLSAHDAHVVGAYRLAIGWGEEPAFAGMRNAVTVEITEAVGRAPVTDLGGGSLSAEVTFGDERLVLPLRANPEHRNTFQATILPTRPGTYAFHITGSLKNQPIDLRSTCSAHTFDCVVSPAEVQFPARDPSVGELSERLERSSPRADRALELAGRAQMLAAGAVGIAALAIVVSIRFGRRRRR